MTEHPGEQFPPDVDPDVEPAFEPYPSEEEPEQPDYDTEPAPQGFSYDGSAAYGETGADTEQAFEASLEHPHSDQPETAESAEMVEPVEHVDPAEVEFGPEFARAPGEEHEHPFAAESAVPPPTQQEAPPEDATQQEAPPEDAAQHAAPFEDAGPDEAQGEEGHVLVEEVRRRLDGLGERAVSEHAEVYADLHERLQDALVEADADSGDRA